MDTEYENVINKYGDSIWNDSALLEAGKAFASLHKAQYTAVKTSKSIKNLKGDRKSVV